MSYPYIKNKHEKSSITCPKKHLDYKFELGLKPTFDCPHTVIFCYQSSFFEGVKENYPHDKCDGYFKQLLFLENYPGVAIGEFGIGAPVAVAKLELLAAWGVKNFISIGHAGSLQQNVKIGELVLCDKALRDEGTSHHYLPYEPFAMPSQCLTQSFKSNLDAMQIPYHMGATWTTDAFFRHTEEEVRHYQSEGILTVEMEAAALFSVAKALNVKIAAAFSISDSLADCQWSSHFQSESTAEGMHHLLKCALQSTLTMQSTGEKK